MEESISDLFLCRVDDTWETQYELMNLPSLLVPGKTAVDNVTMIIYDAYGNEISRNIIKLNPFESKKILQISKINCYIAFELNKSISDTE
jgi:hypothetical protein